MSAWGQSHGMDPERLPRLIIVLFVLVVVGLALGSVATGSNLAAFIDPLSEVFVPVFLLAVFLAIVLYVIGQIT